MITITGSTLETQPGIIQRATQPLAREGINLFGVVTIHSSIRLFVSSERAREALRLVREATAATGR
jgi:aspartokinase